MKFFILSSFILLFFNQKIFCHKNNVDGLYGYLFQNNFSHHPQNSAFQKNNFSARFNILPNVFLQGKLASLIFFDNKVFFIEKTTLQMEISFLQYSDSDFFDETKQQVQNITYENIHLLNNFSFQIGFFYVGFNFHFTKEMISDFVNENIFDADFGISYLKDFNFFLIKNIHFATSIKNIFDPLESLQFNLGLFANLKKIKLNSFDVLFSCYLGMEIKNYFTFLLTNHLKFDYQSYCLIFNLSWKNFNLQQNRFSGGFGIEINDNTFLIAVEEFIPDFYRYGFIYERKLY